MNGYLFDTCMVGHYFCEHPNVIARVDALPDDTPVLVSAIALGEIEFGAAITYSTDHERRHEFLRFINNRFHRKFAVSVERHTRVHYGDLKARLFNLDPERSRRLNHPERIIYRATGAELGIDENDLWMAAQAIEHNLILVTNDEMANIRLVAPELDVEDWTLPLAVAP